MLTIWTSADAATIRKVMGPILGRTPVEHTIQPVVLTNIDGVYTGTIPTLNPGDVLLACGTKALEVLIKAGLFPKGRTVTSLRGHERVLGGGSVFVTFDPTITTRDYARFPEIQWDTSLAIRKHNTGTTEPVIGKYRWVESLHEMIEEIDRRYEATNQPVVIACDTETMGLDEYKPGVRILSISFTIDPGKSDMLYFNEGEKLQRPKRATLPWEDDEAEDYWQELWQQVNWILTSPKVSTRGANWKYDSRWINQHWGIDCTNCKMDTLLLGSLLDENRSNSLKLHAKLFTNMGGYEDTMDRYDMGHLELCPQEELGPYMGGDTDATYQVSEVFKVELLKDRQLATFYTKLLHPSARVFEKLERTGMVVDVPYYERLSAEITVEQARLQAEMKKLVPRKLYIKFLEEFTDTEKSPFTKPKVMRELFFTSAGYNLKPTVFTEKAGDPSTAQDHLLSLSGDSPEAKEFITLMGELASANKTQSTYVKGFMKHLRSDGRFHPHYMLFRGGYANEDDASGADTGRTSCRDPAAQTIPKHTKWTKKLRRAFTCPVGKTILQLDFSQGELRIAACLADEQTMIAAYSAGQDLHSITAAKLTGYSMDDFMLLPDDVRDELRSNGKAGNFGLLYGMGPEGFVEYAKASYGVEMTIDAARQNKADFFELYSGLAPWHERYKNMARMHGQIRSPLGRIRHLPLITSKDRQAASKAERNAINSPVQATLSDMMQLAMVAIDREYGAAGVVEMFMMTHDSVGAYVPIEDERIWAKRLQDIMQNLPLKRLFGWDHQLNFTVDAESCIPDDEGVRSFAYLKKLKNL